MHSEDGKVSAAHIYVLRNSILCLKDSIDKMKLRYVWVEESSHITAGIPHNDIGTFSFKASLLSLNEDSTIQFESASNTSLSVGQLIVAGGSGIHYLYSLQVIVAETFNLNGFLEPVPSSSVTKGPSENTNKEIYIQADFLEGG